MRALAAPLLAIAVCACAAPVLPLSPAPSGPASPVPASAVVATPRPSVDGHPLSELLPATIAGEAARVTDLDPVNRNSPRVFLKVIARLGETPDDGEVALAFVPQSTVYAVRVDGASGSDVLVAYLAERGYPSDESPPTETMGGKAATRLGSAGGVFLYAMDDVFYYVNCADDQRAAELLQLLP
jgi:hypothetical protein